jgi:hypothetical protein
MIAVSTAPSLSTRPADDHVVDDLGAEPGDLDALAAHTDRVPQGISADGVVC